MKYYISFVGIEIRAQREIKKGEELTIQYQSLFTGSRKRREMFRRVWYFDCECRRCQDPSELGSYLNAFICPIDSGKNVNFTKYEHVDNMIFLEVGEISKQDTRLTWCLHQLLLNGILYVKGTCITFYMLSSF